MEGGGADLVQALVDGLVQIETVVVHRAQTHQGLGQDPAFRVEDHQAMQSMYHFKIKVDPAFAWGVPDLVREIKPEEMNVPIKNKR